METIVEVEGGWCVKLKPINDDTTVIRFVLSKEYQAPIPIPYGFTFFNKTTKKNMESYRDEFFASWTSSYELLNGDKPVLIVE